MIYSMTGFANSVGNYDAFNIEIELKSVNHRFLNISLKLPDELKSLEHKLTSVVSSYISRGKFECRIRLNPNTEENEININETLAIQLIEVNKKLIRKNNALDAMSVTDLLKFPGVLLQQEIDLSQIESSLIHQLKETAEKFNQCRLREGEELKLHIAKRLEKIQVIIDHILVIFPNIISEYSLKLKEKVNSTIDSVDENRLNQEIALFIQKVDIDEELSRLQSHVKEVKRIIEEKKESILGKRLDFMMQEFHREANTLGSKSFHTECTQASIELKVLIEQMREQIQNIE